MSDRRTGSFRHGIGIFLTTVILFASLDLVSKELVFDALQDEPGMEHELWEGVFKFKLTTNPGMMWGMAGQVPAWLWIVIRGSVLVLLIYFFFSLDRRGAWAQLAFGLVAAGAIGNIADNIFHDEVRDFLHFYAFEFPTFNVADSCICVGAPLLLVIMWNHDRRRVREAATGGS